MYESKNAYNGLEGVAADIFLNIGLNRTTEENLFIIKEKIRNQLAKQREEIFKILNDKSVETRAAICEKIKILKIEDGF
jgi:hypothetical protein